MNIARKLAPLGATLTLAAVPTAALAVAAAPAGAAAHQTTVTVRVEGAKRTLVALTKVHLKAGGWIRRDGIPTGVCSTASALGALDAATHHTWAGSYDAQYSSVFVDSIRRVSYAGKKAKDYWAFFAGNVMASAGVCEVTPRAGEPILFAAVPLTDTGDYVVGLSAHGTAHAGQAFTVKVIYYTATGKARPLAGATVTGTGIAPATTNSQGLATITPSHAGTLVLTAAHADTKVKGEPWGYIRPAALKVAVTG